jgi:hypothetical protein
MLYYAANSAVTTTAGALSLATAATSASANSSKTMLQIAPPSTQATTRIVAVGVEFSAVLANAVTFEVLETSGAATVTAHVAAGVMPYGGDAIGGTSTMTLGTTATGYNASGEGTPTAIRVGKFKVIPAGAAEYEWEWSLGREFSIAGGKFLRIRLAPTTAASVNALVWAIWDE